MLGYFGEAVGLASHDLAAAGGAVQDAFVEDAPELGRTRSARNCLPGQAGGYLLVEVVQVPAGAGGQDRAGVLVGLEQAGDDERLVPAQDRGPGVRHLFGILLGRAALGRQSVGIRADPVSSGSPRGWPSQAPRSLAPPPIPDRRRYSSSSGLLTTITSPAGTSSLAMSASASPHQPVTAQASARMTASMPRVTSQAENASSRHSGIWRSRSQ